MVVLLARLMCWKDEAYLCGKLVCHCEVVYTIIGPAESDYIFQLLIRRTDMI